MTGETVLIAAFSARALTQAARRAGYRPLAIDAFGDLDTREAAYAWRMVEGAMRNGFRTKPLIAAIDALVADAPTSPIGLVLGSGFEDKPRLVAALAARYTLLGASAEMIRTCKEPRSFFAALGDLSVPHPETRSTLPEDPHHWLTKRIGGSGGRHIRACQASTKIGSRRYFQKRLDGERLSVGGIFTPTGNRLTITQQWIAPSKDYSFRYGGAVSHPQIDADIARQLIDTATKVAAKLKLRGMASFDFISDGRQPYLLEVNPRPGASLDVLDGGMGDLFEAHIAANRNEAVASSPSSTPPEPAPVQPSRAAAILHAGRGPVTFGEMDWPTWTADRAAPGTYAPHGEPLATVFAESTTASDAERKVRQRLAELEDLIYEHAKR